MGYKLRRMIRDGAPPEWSPLMRLVACEIADDAHDPGREKDPLPSPDDWPNPWASLPIEGEYRRGDWRDGLVERCGMSARAVSRTLADLAEAKYDMRDPITDRDGNPVRDRRGRLVYAAKGHAVRFVVPHLPPRAKPQSSPEVASNGTLPGCDSDSSPEVASISDQADDDWECLPDSASTDPQRSPLLVPKVATSGDPVSSASPNVKTVPQAAAARLAKDQDPEPGALRLPQVANSKTTSSRLNDQQVTDDAQHFPRHDSERTTDGTGARARRADTPAA